MTDYMVGKEIALLQQELEKTQMLLNEVYKVVSYNIEAKKLEEPKEKK